MTHFFRHIASFILGNKFLVAAFLAAGVAFSFGYSVRDLARFLADIGTSVSLDVPTKARVEAGFSVSDGATGMASRVIQSSAASVDVLGFGSSGPDLSPAILNIMSRGIRVRAIVSPDALQSDASGSLRQAAELLKARGAEVRVLAPSIATREVIVVTDGLHVCGSSIQDGSAPQGMAYAMWNMPEVGAAYRQYFSKLWESGQKL